MYGFAGSSFGFDQSFPRPRRRIPSRDAAEDGAGHEAGAAGVVVVVEAADDFAGGVKAGDRMA